MADLAGLDGGEVDSDITRFGVNAVGSVVFTGVFWGGLGQGLVDTFSAHFRKAGADVRVTNTD